ncbi:sensor histidine kinase, partial [Kibdelosporangium lantanae]
RIYLTSGVGLRPGRPEEHTTTDLPPNARHNVRNVMALARAPAWRHNLNLWLWRRIMPRLAERLVANLIDNALRHNVADGTVEIGTGVVDGSPELSVGNTGPEVPAGDIEELLQPFRRRTSDRSGKKDKDTDGFGLGLSIVQAIVRAHDAALDVQPRPGGGLTIRVVFGVLVRGAETEKTTAVSGRHVNPQG